MDGVLIDSEPLHFRAYEELMNCYDARFTEEMNNQFLGMKDSEIAPLIVEEHKLPLSPDLFVKEKDNIFHTGF